MATRTPLRQRQSPRHLRRSQSRQIIRHPRSMRSPRNRPTIPTQTPNPTTTRTLRRLRNDTHRPIRQAHRIRIRIHNLRPPPLRTTTSHRTPRHITRRHRTLRISPRSRRRTRHHRHHRTLSTRRRERRRHLPRLLPPHRHATQTHGHHMGTPRPRRQRHHQRPTRIISKER